MVPIFFINDDLGDGCCSYRLLNLSSLFVSNFDVLDMRNHPIHLFNIYTIEEFLK